MKLNHLNKIKNFVKNWMIRFIQNDCFSSLFRIQITHSLLKTFYVQVNV